MKKLTLAPKKSRGFALVATLMLLLLLLVIAIGLLNISAITLRTSSQNQAQAEARANARLALMIAIGELQKELGPDQRISANGAVLDDPSTLPNEVIHPNWTGVWDSWIAGPLAGAPTNAAYPCAESHHQTVGNQPDASMRPDYANKSKHFRRWLLSLDPNDASRMDSSRSLALNGMPMPAATETAIRLVGEGSLGKTAPSTDFVSARLIDVKATSSNSGGRGRYGWWVGDESQKARVMADSYASTPPANSAEKIFRGQSPGSTGTITIRDLEGITAAQDAKLKGLPTLNTLDLVVNDPAKLPAKLNFHAVSPFSQSVLSDVREGGLKRDLSVILEQPIDLANQGTEYMLYEFDDSRFPYLNNPNDARRANSRVPIQDLAAYYQLYDHEPTFKNGRRGGVQYSSSALSSSLQIHVPDYDGGIKDNKLLNREYTSLYRRPVVTKIQFLLGVTAQLITQAERDNIQSYVDGTKKHGNPAWQPNFKPIRTTDKYKLRLGIQPLVTLWNPSNLPLVMESKQRLIYNAPPFGIKMQKYRDGIATPFESRWMNLGYANDTAGGTTAGQGGGALLSLRLAKNTIVFEPGEVKVFSLPSSSASNLTDGGSNVLQWGGTILDVENTWDPFGVFLMRNTAPVGHNGNQMPDVPIFYLDKNAQCLVFGDNDSISVSIDLERASSANSYDDGRNASRSAEIQGAGFSLYMFDEGWNAGHWSTWAEALRHDNMISRHGSQTPTNRTALGGFYQQLMFPGFPGGQAPIPFDSKINAIPASQIIGSIAAKEIIAIMDFSLSIGCETSSIASGGFGGGRRITSRPFLHSATSAMPFIAQSEKDSLYDYGWDWQVSKINTVEDSILQAKPGSGNGYYGGGYTVELGTTHVIQSEIPVLPPISIASLSHAHLGGFSMAKAIPVGENPDTDKFWNKSVGAPVTNPIGVSYQRTTAAGQNGLAPHIVQAIGNSYAHPNIPADKAFVMKLRTFDLDEGSKNVPFADHSYLANKALWDEYFFSSVSPQPSKVELFGGTSRTAKQVADEFFFGSGSSLLPNRRMLRNKNNLNQAKFDELFTQANSFSNGLADKIASYLIVDGAFNVNSTSVEAWKVLFSSLRGKPVAYLESGKTPLESVSADKTAVNPGMLPNAKPVSSSAISSPNNPKEQWKTGRELTDAEIGELAEAMVKQVKFRGPFLSMSEFINRRLDGSNDKDMALKGALQAALDDPAVSINAQFRTPARKLDDEVAGAGFIFPDAAKGPIAYGSQPYVDQADILRGLAEQLTPRGDSFLIRTYGDSVDAQGNVVARAWCEAVVQRVPEYVNAADEPHLKQSDPALSAQSKQFGRKIQIVSFRWVNSSEI